VPRRIPATPRAGASFEIYVGRHDRTTIKLLLLSGVAAALLVVPSHAAAKPAGPQADYLPQEAIVRYHADAGRAAQASVESSAGAVVADALPGGSKRLQIEDGESVRQTVAKLRDDPRVAYAVPNYVARASAFLPNDRGFSLQWNFSGPFGINMPEAWSLARRWNAPGGRGATVAVLDTGLAYRNLAGYHRAPDLGAVVRGYDFVDGDPYPLDLNGHGTHVAGTIAEATNNRIGAAGIAYGARIMPVRTLNAYGAGNSVTISNGIRYAARHGADVINLSLEFPQSIRAADLPDLLAAIRYARRHGVVLTAVAGNEASTDELPFPARAKGVIAVAATTESGCQAAYSNAGLQVDVAAPGGGDDAAPAADDAWGLAHCHPGVPGRSIYQQTYSAGLSSFGLPAGYYGTSMAAPHVAGVAALLISSGRLGRHPRPDAVERRIEQTARDIGPPGYDVRHGHGLIDAAAALR
jgi:serine protease